MMASSLKRPRGVLFDIGGTVLGERWHEPSKGFARLLELARWPTMVDPVEFQRFASSLYIESRKQHDVGPTEIRLQSVLRLLCERFGIHLNLDLPGLELEFWKAICAMAPEPGIDETLAALRDRGIPTGAVSNSVFSSSAIEYELARHGLLERFQFVMATADYGFQKPHLAIFETAVAKLGLRPEQVWFVGDNYHKDVAGATKADLTAIWYNPTGAMCPDDATPLQVLDWSEFGDLVDEAAAHCSD